MGPTAAGFDLALGVMARGDVDGARVQHTINRFMRDKVESIETTK